MHDEPVEIETELPPLDAPEDDAEVGTVDAPGLDSYDPLFPLPESLKAFRRLDSRRWLVLPERYIYRPLSALDAARAVDQMIGGAAGKALLKCALTLRRQREALRGVFADEGYDPETVEALTDDRMLDALEVAMEELVGDLEGKGFELTAWALGWIERCQVRRVPLPTSADIGGPVYSAKGPASWEEFYAGRFALLHRLGAACAWGSLSPFFVVPRPAA